MIRVYKNSKESNDRIIQKFANRIKASRLVQTIKDKRYHSRKKTKRQIRAAALMREFYRSKREKMKYYS